MKALESVLEVVRDQSGEAGVWRTLTAARVTELRRRVRALWRHNDVLLA
jgi:hypothetical protein